MRLVKATIKSGDYSLEALDLQDGLQFICEHGDYKIFGATNSHISE